MSFINTLEPHDSNDRRYPRKGPLRRVRTILLVCWTIFAYYFGNALWNFYQLANTHPNQLKGFRQILAALVLPAPLPMLNLPFWIVIPCTIPFCSVLLACAWATLDLRQEQKVTQQQETLHTIFHKLIDHLSPPLQHTVVRDLISTDISNRSSKDFGPPFDVSRLPQPTPFVVHKADLQWLIARLHRGKGSDNDVTLLYGLPGMGKTTLVANAISRLFSEGRFRDGIAVYDCKGQTNATKVLQKVLQRFDPQRCLSENDSLDDMTHRLLNKKDALVVLLNVEPNLPIDKIVVPLSINRVTVLLTAQQTFTQIPMEASRKLEALDLKEALGLFVQSLGGDLSKLSDKERSAAERIVHILGCHPFAIKLAGSASMNRDLERVARDLVKNPHSEPAVMRAFEESIKGLPAQTQQLFVAFVAFPTIEFGRQAVEALTEKFRVADASSHIDQLVRRSLLEATLNKGMPAESDRERLRVHPLLRAFATQKFERLSQRRREAAQGAIAHYYADYTRKMTENMYDSVLSADESNIAGALEWALGQGNNELATALYAGMQSLWFNRRNLADIKQGLAVAKEVASTTKKPENDLLVANLAMTYGRLLQQNGQLVDAEKNFQESLDIYRDLQNRRGTNKVLACIGQVAQQLGQLEKAADHYRQSRDTLHDLQDQPEEARQREGVILDYMGALAWQRGHSEEAVNYCQESLNIFRDLQGTQARRSETQVFVRLGEIFQDLGRRKEAKNYYLKALKIARKEQDRQSEDWVLGHLGSLAQVRRQPGEAEDYYLDALRIAQELQDKQCEAWVLARLGSLAQAWKQPEMAEDYYQEALKIVRDVQDKQCEGWILSHLATLSQTRKLPGEAENYFREALDITQDVQGLANYAILLLASGSFLAKKSDKHKQKEGCQQLKQAILLCAKIGLPEEKEARKMLERHGCKELNDY